MQSTGTKQNDKYRQYVSPQVQGLLVQELLALAIHLLTEPLLSTWWDLNAALSRSKESLASVSGTVNPVRMPTKVVVSITTAVLPNISHAAYTFFSTIDARSKREHDILQSTRMASWLGQFFDMPF